MSARDVLVVTPSLAAGGAERHSAYLATALDPGRWRVAVLSFADGPLRPSLEAAGVPVRLAPLPGGARSVPAAAAAVRSAVDQLRPALVSGHSVLVETALRWGLRGTPVPVVAWKHTYGHIGYRGMRERLFEQLTGHAVARYAAVCHTQVRYLTDELGLPPEKIAVVPNGVPVPTRPVDLPSGPPVVLMAAAMRADKDHARVLDAWGAVLRSYPDARLLLAGDGPMRARLQRRAIDLGIGHAVDFLGVRTDIDDMLHRSHLVVLASYAVECFPYAALEAMAAGRGVVSTDVGGLPELVDDGVTGRLVPPRSTEALTGALLEGLDDACGSAPSWGVAGWRRASDALGLDRWTARVDHLFSHLVTESAQRLPDISVRTDQ